MRIALITRRYPPLIGGAEKVLSYLAPAFQDAGAQVTVVTSAIPGVETPGDEASPVPVVRLPTAATRFVGTWRYMGNLRRWLEGNPVDLAYVSMLKHDAYVAVGVGRRKGFPVVLRPEGAGATGDLAWQAWGRGGKAIGRRCRGADGFVAISPAIRGELLAAGYDAAKVHDLPNGVPVPAEPWGPRGGEASRAVFVGRLAPEKGLGALVEAWGIVRRARPGAVLRLIGEGPEREGLEALVERLGLRGAVELPGAVADPAAELRGADLFVLPSKEEGMSIALLEAMALGVPAVASAIPGNAALVADGVEGRLAALGDPGALARAILDQWADPARAGAMAAAGRAKVAEHYSIGAVARRHLDLFERLIAEARRPC